MHIRSANWMTRLPAYVGVVALIAFGYFARDTGLIDKALLLKQQFFPGNQTVLVWQKPVNGFFGGHIPTQAIHLFSVSGKGPRADRFFDAAEYSAPTRRPQVMTASMTPILSEPDPMDGYAVNRNLKGGRDAVKAVAPSHAQPVDAAQPSSADRATAALFFVSSYASTGMKAAEPATESPDAGDKERLKDSAPEGSEWRRLLQDARMSPEDATIFGGLTETEFRNKEMHCMATAIYFEARGEPTRGQMAVAQVVMNRVRTPFYPKTICGVVYQGSFNRTGCQFSFTCDGIADRATNKEQWANSMTVAQQVIARKVWVDEVGYATHYHATYVNPKWKALVKRVAQIGVHIFYKAPFADPQLAYANTQPS
ncbi:MAG: cell wall hydrolase [Chitinophagales bacterium]|nr:cell wall hydrolase [Hyphomicrobiales bacterium]